MSQNTLTLVLAYFSSLIFYHSQLLTAKLLEISFAWESRSGLDCFESVHMHPVLPRMIQVPLPFASHSICINIIGLHSSARCFEVMHCWIIGVYCYIMCMVDRKTFVEMDFWQIQDVFGHGNLVAVTDVLYFPFQLLVGSCGDGAPRSHPGSHRSL